MSEYRVHSVYSVDELPDLKKATGDEPKYVMCPSCFESIGTIADLATDPNILTNKQGHVICKACAEKL